MRHDDEGDDVAVRAFHRFVLDDGGDADVMVGEDAGQVPLRKLQKHLKKLPKKLNKVQLRELRSRIKAVGGLNIPIPKGPMAMNRNAKIPKR